MRKFDVVEEISEQHAASPHTQCMRRKVEPGERDHRQPNRAEDDRASEIGLAHEEEGDRRGDQRRQHDTGSPLSFSRISSQAKRHEHRFEELGGLDLAASRS